MDSFNEWMQFVAILQCIPRIIWFSPHCKTFSNFIHRRNPCLISEIRICWTCGVAHDSPIRDHLSGSSCCRCNWSGNQEILWDLEACPFRPSAAESATAHIHIVNYAKTPSFLPSPSLPSCGAIHKRRLQEITGFDLSPLLSLSTSHSFVCFWGNQLPLPLQTSYVSRPLWCLSSCPPPPPRPKAIKSS